MKAPFPTLMVTPGVPWRIKNRIECWMEGSIRHTWPGLYRWLHLGSAADLARPITQGPKHHFFGYYDKSPWNASQSLLLAHESDFNDRAPKAGDMVRIGTVQADERRFMPLAETPAWNWQQGAMLAWFPGDAERTLVHNDRRNGTAVGVLRDISGTELRCYDRPIYALAPDGKLAWSLNFARLATHRPGYGYAGIPDPWTDELQPGTDGIHQIELETGRSHLIVSTAELAQQDPTPAMVGQHHWLNHIQPSPKGTRIAFFHLWREGEQGWGVRLYVCAPDGSGLFRALDTGRISHYEWYDEDRLLIWARRHEGGERFLLVDVRDASYSTFAEGVLTEDGHDSFSPDRRWVLNDTYPDRHDMRTLMLVRWPDGKRIDIARIYSPKSKWWGEIRCDMHPRWSRDGRQVCIDSVHDGTRQMYVLDTSRWTG